MFSRSARYSPELRARAVQLVAALRRNHTSEQGAIQTVAGLLGIDSPRTLRKWVRQARIDPEMASSTPIIRSAFRRFWLRPHTIIAGSVIVVLGGLGLVYSQQFLGVSQQSIPSQASQLEVDQVGLSYRDLDASSVSPFDIDIKLLNMGPQTAAINAARIVIQQSVTLPMCASQGTFYSTGNYQTNLPANPSPGQVVEVPISQLVPANGADRFDLLLTTNFPRTGDGLFNVYVYRIHVYLTYNVDTKPLDIGEILVNSPAMPGPGNYFWSKYWAANVKYFTFMVGGANYEPAAKDCAIKNSFALHSILSLPAMRTPQLSAIAPQLAYR